MALNYCAIQIHGHLPTAVKGQTVLPKRSTLLGVWHSGQVTNGVLESLGTLLIDTGEL